MIDKIFIRHAQSEYNASLTNQLDSCLTPLGREQALATAEFLLQNIPDLQEYKAKTSPYLRCLQTSQIIQDVTGLDFEVVSGPREIMYKYDACEVPFRNDLYPHYAWNLTENYNFLRETVPEYVQRLKIFTESIRHDKVLIVSHGSPVVSMYEIMQGKDHVPDEFYVRNASVTYLKNGESIYYGHTIHPQVT